jgi:ATP adenylyltransferase
VNKPYSTSDVSAHEVEAAAGSDIDVRGLSVCGLGSCHILSFNKFAAFRPHYLILTSDGFKRQWEPLNLDDFRAVHDLYARDPADSLVFFNCRSEAGCSRLHKHLQAIPKDSFDGNPWVNVERSLAGEAEPLPYAFTFHKHASVPSAEDNYRIYDAALRLVERALDLPTTPDGVAPPHNVIMDRERIMVIPRRAAGLEDIALNAGGMLGIVWTQTEATLTRWLELGPRNLLEAAGTKPLPKD